MRKLSKVILASLVLLGVCFLASCNTKTDDKDDPKGDDPVIELRKALDSIELDTAGVKKEFYLGQAFDSTGLKVQAQFANNTTEDVSSSVVVNSESFDSNSLGKYAIIVSYTYEGRVRTGKYTVEVKTILDNNIKHLVGLNVIVPEDDTSEEGQSKDKEYIYNVGEDFDVSDVKFEAVYSDDSKVSVPAEDVVKNYDGVDKTTAGNYTVVFSKTESYSDSGVTQEVTVKNFVIVTYLNPITEMTFKSGTVEFDFGTEFTDAAPMSADWVFEVTHKNGDKVEITHGIFTTSSNVNTNLAGESTIVVSYQEMGVTKTCNVLVTVKPDPNANKGLNVVLNANDLALVNPLTEDLVINPYFTIRASSSAQSKIDSNSKTYEPRELSFDRRINLNGKYNSQRSIEITMPKEGTITVVFSQTNAGRKMSLYKDGVAIEDSIAETGGNDVLVEHTFSVDEAGVYQLGCAEGGIYVWYIALGEPLEA